MNQPQQGAFCMEERFVGGIAKIVLVLFCSSFTQFFIIITGNNSSELCRELAVCGVRLCWFFSLSFLFFLLS